MIYPEYKTEESLLNGKALKQEIKNLWAKLPIFRDSASKVPVLHIPLLQSLVKSALDDKGFMVNTKKEPDEYAYRG